MVLAGPFMSHFQLHLLNMYKSSLATWKIFATRIHTLIVWEGLIVILHENNLTFLLFSAWRITNVSLISHEGLHLFWGFMEMFPGKAVI